MQMFHALVAETKPAPVSYMHNIFMVPNLHYTRYNEVEGSRGIRYIHYFVITIIALNSSIWFLGEKILMCKKDGGTVARGEAM